MLRTTWQTHSDVGDASLFVQEICSLVEDVTLVCKDILSDEYFQSFCASFATAFLPQFVLALHRCKRIGDVGAQQLLLDTYGIKTLFLGLRSLGEEEEDAGTRRMDPYTKRVLREVSKAESLLKVGWLLLMVCFLLLRLISHPFFPSSQYPLLTACGLSLGRSCTRVPRAVADGQFE